MSSLILRNCNNLKNELYVGAQFSSQLPGGYNPNINKVVSLDEYPYQCWIITDDEKDVPSQNVTLQVLYDTCEDCLPCFLLTSCDGTETISSRSLNLLSHIGNTIKIAGSDKCFIVSEGEDCSCAVDVIVTHYYSDCNECTPNIGYRLTNCDSPSSIIYSIQDLSSYIGKTVELFECPGCWLVEQIDILPPTTQDITITYTFDSCNSCNNEYWLLTDCSDQDNQVITESDLSVYEGRVVKLTYCPDKCWTVQSTRLSTNAEIVWIENDYVDCQTCIDDVPEVVPEVVEQPKRKVKPGYSTPTCSPEYFEKVMCRFSEIMYKDVLSKRYGINTCCPEDLIKWEIKKEMLDLESLIDLNYECTASGCGCDTIVHPRPCDS